MRLYRDFHKFSNDFSLLCRFTAFKAHSSNSTRDENALQPFNRLSTSGAESEESPLLRARKGYKEGLNLFLSIRHEAPPGMIVEAIENNCVEFETLAFVNCHQWDLTPALKLVESIRPRVRLLKRFLK